MDQSNKIIIISGTSGSGKTTLVNFLLAQIDLRLAFSISACTRKRRPLEKDGINYFFLSTAEFKSKISNNDFLEWEEVYQNQFYGTLKTSANQLLKSGYNVLFDVDVRGALSIKRYFKDRSRTIFIKPSSVVTAKKRLIDRETESKHQLEKRISKMENELKFATKMDHMVINDVLADSKSEIYHYVKDFLSS